MTLTEDDFDNIATPSTANLNDIEAKVYRATEILHALEKLEEKQSILKAEYVTITEKELPDLMASAGTAKFETDSGVKVAIRDFVRGSLPKDQDDRAKAIQWIEEHGASDIIKDVVKIEFGKKEHNFAIDFKAKLARDGVGFSSDVGVHPQTLAKFARERMENGEPVEFSILGLYAGREAKIVLPKKEKI